MAGRIDHAKSHYARLASLVLLSLTLRPIRARKKGQAHMGLALSVGILADLRENDEDGYEYFKSQLEALNRYLQRTNIREHMEPEDCEVWSADMFGYSGLHYLRRIAAHLDLTGRLPSPGGDDSSKDPILEKYYQAADGVRASFISRLLGKQKDFKRSFDHLILHSDAEGFYLPIDFPGVLFPDDSFEIAGCMVGSSYQLLRVCERIAAALEIPPDLDETSDALWEAADSQGEGSVKWERYGIETFSCVCLRRGCRKSIESKAALVFT